MNFENYSDLMAVCFFVGMGAGVLLCGAVANAFWKISAFYCSAHAAARIAEKCLQEAEIRVAERRLEEAKVRLSNFYADVMRGDENQAVTK